MEEFCDRHGEHTVLKEGCRKLANGTSALDVAIDRSLQYRPTNCNELISLDNSPDKSASAV